MEQNYGLVLAGGGTRGAFEVGACKALSELNIRIKGIVGTSIGAINGALLFQDDYPKMEQIYRSIEPSDIFTIHHPIDTTKDLLSIHNIRALVKEFVRSQGLNNQPLRKMMEANIDTEKIYQSDKDFGLVAFSINDLAPVELFKEDIPQDELIDFILASACYPIFKPQHVQDKQFIDGGIYDVAPINMLIRKGYRKILVVDLTDGGALRKLEKKDGIYVKMIRPSEDLGGGFEFNQQRIQKNINLGYLDTLKEFHHLQGHNYYFTNDSFNQVLQYLSLNMIYGLEFAAELLGIERLQIFDAEVFLYEVAHEYQKAKNEYDFVNDKGFFGELLRNPKLITKIDDLKSLLVWFEERILSQPNFKVPSPIGKIFEDFVTAGRAIIELNNILKV